MFWMQLNHCICKGSISHVYDIDSKFKPLSNCGRMTTHDSSEADCVNIYR